MSSNSCNDKKAFTLVEIIAVIVILGVITLIAVPSVVKYLDDTRKTTYLSYENTMENAAKNITIGCLENPNGSCEAPRENEKQIYYLNELVEKGYLDLMKDPEGTGFCDGELSYVEIANTGREYVYYACLYCGNYKTENATCSSYVVDNDLPTCGDKTGEGSQARWINTNRTVSVKCSDATSGCTRNTFTKTFTETTRESFISIADKSGNKRECPVSVYVDKTPPTCEIEVTGTYDSDYGWYTGSVSAELVNWQDTDSHVLTYGIGTTLEGKEYNKSTTVSVSSGITTIIGYVKDNAGNEGYCTKTVRVGAVRPEFDFRYGYQIYPNGETKTLSGITESGSRLTTTNTTPTITIKNLNKYTNVDRVVITLNSPIPTSTTGTVSYTGSANGSATAPMVSGSKKIVFTIPKGNYSQMDIQLGTLSGKTYDVSKIELLTTNGGVFTNKDVTIKIDPIDTGVRTVGYSFDGGSTFKASDTFAFSSNTSGTLVTKNSGNMYSFEKEYAITGIDKKVPTVTLAVTQKDATADWTNNKWSNKPLDFTFTAGNVGISGATIYYCYDTNNTCTPNTVATSGTKITSLESLRGTYYVRYLIVNQAGTSSVIGGFTAKVDMEAPTCSLKAEGVKYTGSNRFIDTATVSFASTSDDGGSNIAGYGIGNVTGNKTINHTANSTVEYTGYIADGAGNVGTCKITVEKNSELTVTYSNEGGTGCTTKTVNYNSQYGNLCEPTRTGYLFQGWYTNTTGGTKINTNTTVTATSDHTVYARWTPACPTGYSIGATNCYKTYTAYTNYRCPTDYTLSGTTCSKGETVEATLSSYSCPSGGTLSNTSCVTTSSYTASVSSTYCAAGDWTYTSTFTSGTCNSGSRPSNPVNGSTYQTCHWGYWKAYCSNESQSSILNRNFYSNKTGACNARKCPSGTTCKGVQGYAVRHWVYTCTSTGYNYYCPNGGTLNVSTCTTSSSYNATPNYVCDTGWTLNGSVCSRTLTQAAEVYYTCDSGDSRDETTCTHTVPFGS